MKPLIGITGDIDSGRFSAKMSYVSALEGANACPIFLPPISSRNLIREYAITIDALLISGGGDINPVFYGEKQKALSLIPLPRGEGMRERVKNIVSDKRFSFEKTLLSEIMIQRKPVLGICYGMQFLNVFLGGTLYQDLKAEGFNTVNHKSEHRIKIYKRSRLFYILGREYIRVNSSHHQGIKEPGRGLIIGASSKDKLIEAIELKGYPYFIGVQWHPERLMDRNSQTLFKSFVKAVLISAGR